MEQKHMFTNKMIADLLIPVVLEQLLNSIMGTADTMMVSNVGSAAISAVSVSYTHLSRQCHSATVFQKVFPWE